MMLLAQSIKDLNLVNLIRAKHRQYVSRDAVFHEEQGRNDNASSKNQDLGSDNLACLKYKEETLSGNIGSLKELTCSEIVDSENQGPRDSIFLLSWSIRNKPVTVL